MADRARGEEHDEANIARAEEARGEQLAALSRRDTRLSGDERALLGAQFAAMMRAHHAGVWEVFRRRGLPERDVEDLVQETFAELHDHLLEKGFPGSVRGLVLTIAGHQLLNHLRSRRRSPETVGLPSSGSETPTSAKEMERALDLRALYQQLIPTLSPDQQEVVEKVILNGMSYEDAAEALEIPEGTLKSRLIAAKKKLYALAVAMLPPSQRKAS